MLFSSQRLLFFAAFLICCKRVSKDVASNSSAQQPSSLPIMRSTRLRFDGCDAAVSVLQAATEGAADAGALAAVAGALAADAGAIAADALALALAAAPGALATDAGALAAVWARTSSAAVGLGGSAANAGSFSAAWRLTDCFTSRLVAKLILLTPRPNDSRLHPASTTTQSPSSCGFCGYRSWLGRRGRPVGAGHAPLGKDLLGTTPWGTIGKLSVETLVSSCQHPEKKKRNNRIPRKTNNVAQVQVFGHVKIGPEVRFVGDPTLDVAVGDVDVAPRDQPEVRLHRAGRR